MTENLNPHDIEQYLIKNPEFLKTYLSKHGAPDITHKDGSHSEPSSPEIKIKRLPNFTGGRGNSITTSIFKKYVEGNLERIKKSSKDRNQLLSMPEDEVFMELIRDIATELDVNVLCHKILKNVSILTRSDRGSLFLVRGTKENRYLVSKLFDVTEVSTITESLHTEETEIIVPFGKGIAGFVAESKETVNIKSAYEDPRFNKDVDLKTGYRTHSILCMPILNYEGEVIGVAQIINKVSGNHEFTKQDEDVFRKYLIFCGIGITNAQLFELSVLEYKRNQLLLNLARGVFEEQTSLERLIQKVMLDSQDMLKCERCTVYLTEESTNKDPLPNEDNTVQATTKPTSTKEVQFSMTFDLYAKDGGNIRVPSAAEVAKWRNAEIARHVVLKGTPLSITEAEIDAMFGKGVEFRDEEFKTKNMLCMPIFNNEKKIIGVTQLVNKLNGVPFNENDANIIEAFSIFTGLGIHNCQMYENACRLMAKQTVALEVLSYHATAQKDETDKLMASDFPSGQNIGLYTFEFNDIPLDELETVKCTITMFTEANLLSEFKIPLEVMCRWTLSVKKNYRPVTYHNWRHAFNVTQTMFTILYTGGMIKKFEGLEVLALLVACLCHDLDHRGTNNAFQVKVASPLAMLYSTSVMEHHHFDHCIMILNSEGNNIFQSLSSAQYRNVIKMLEHAILSTDLALYFKKRGDFQKLVKEGELEYRDPNKKDLLKAMLMTACDVAAITKPWEIQEKVAQLVANEFFEQGDKERNELGETPMAMMDREKKDELPKMQVGFIDAICLPIYKMFAEMNQSLRPLYDGVLDNKKHWQELADIRERKTTGKLNDEETEPDRRSHSPEQNGITQKPDNTEQKRKERNVQFEEEDDIKDSKRTKFCILL
ncbi:cGMP-specific 3',5'-cyclic phosphodiesterase-like isoform X2 [Ostrea edulis]|uniref:cGMP-specific 3',5'-cyclic phosphodiesterase-like isoform X2 n=1 Tax=Ostrea edulis TaxID=37623 RepID=UPI0024AF7DEA|nr:cGMP-specific 3',5'-cyclic phosphodiesterase-like isoform X2 [Ostrea edulis]XP_056005408.1 cGMP-specific 3',5'-cyclic phosphodiesterase-like isoform X2 [Ostrea edulis]